MVSFTISSKPYAGDYGGGRQLTALFYEGTITVNSTAYSYVGELKDSGVSWGAPITKGDYVSLVRYASCTYNACKGAFAVKKAAAGEFAIGRCIDYPRVYGLPSTTTTINDSSTWATALAAGYFRYGLIELWAQNVHLVDAPNANTGTAIVAGDGVTYDVSLAGFDYVADLGVSDGNMYDATADSGQNSLLANVNSLNSASADGEDILVAVGLNVVLVKA